jgi:hypothetical protein
MGNLLKFKIVNFNLLIITTFLQSFTMSHCYHLWLVLLPSHTKLEIKQKQWYSARLSNRRSRLRNCRPVIACKTRTTERRMYSLHTLQIQRGLHLDKP